MKILFIFALSLSLYSCGNCPPGQHKDGFSCANDRVSVPIKNGVLSKIWSKERGYTTEKVKCDLGFHGEVIEKGETKSKLLSRNMIHPEILLREKLKYIKKIGKACRQRKSSCLDECKELSVKFDEGNLYTTSPRMRCKSKCWDITC